MIDGNIPDIKTTSNKQPFGILTDGTEVYSYQLVNKNGLEMTVINYGATITSLKIPGKGGIKVDVVAGFHTVEDYIDSFELPSPPYFGAIAGRFAGRINKGKFVIENREYQLKTNHGKHHLHGGNQGFSQVFWEVKYVEGQENTSITLTYTSEDGEENYPGQLTVDVTYTLTDNNELVVAYKAVTTADTIVNLTQHSYFNLEGHLATIEDQELFVNSVKILETDAENIATGNFIDVSGSNLDFSTASKCPHIIDNSYVIENNNQAAAVLSSNKTGIKLSVFTTQPTVHIYVGGNCFGQIKGKENADYHALTGICFEAQNHTDSPNHPEFPSAVLKKEETYDQRTIFLFEVE